MKLIGRTGDVIGRDAVIGEQLRIGTAADNEFRLAAAGVSRHHARVVRQSAEEYWLEDSGSTNGTFVNGLRIARERLRHLDVVTLGRYVDLIAVASEQAAAPPVETVHDAWLEALDGNTVGARIDVPPGEVTLGRTAPSNILIDSPLVSHLHARLERTPDRVVISDLGSSNGTFVNGHALQEPVELTDGDTVSIAGSRYFRVHIDGAAPGAHPRTAAVRSDVFASEWKTRLVWSADELVELEADRQRILAAVRKDAALAAVAHKAEAPKPAPAPSTAKPEPPKPAAPKPAVAKPPVAKPPLVKPEVPTPVPPAPPPAKAAPKPEAPKPEAKPEAPKPAAPPPARGAAPAGAIQFAKLVGATATFKLGPGRHEVGRSDSIALTLFSRQVSRVHAALVVSASEVRVEDLRSANGTLVNGVKLPIGGSAPLKHGDRVAFGDVEFTVELVS
jgi:pSer/pThr/pTyr-binding forkhead associated (FHA) protein